MGNSAEPCFMVQQLTVEEISAIKALHKGEASAYQQTLTLAVIIKKFSMTHDIQFVPGASDQSSFMSGRAYVGMQLLRTINLTKDS